MEYLHWSEQPIEFNREDHPIIVPRPGNAPLVLKAQIGAYDVDRIFMDAESGINLTYAKTLRAMHISLEFLKPTDYSFYGIVPLAISVSRDPRTTRVFTIHGSASLYISGA
jgi:hypothetical protein